MAKAIQSNNMGASEPSNLAIAFAVLLHKAERSLTVDGTVLSVRKQKRVAFARLNDGSSLNSIQVVLSPGQAEKLTNGCAVTIQGQWKESQGQEQDFELEAHAVTLHGETDAALHPIQKQHQTLEYLRTIPHLRARTPFNALLLRLRSQLIAEATKYFSQQGFIQTHTPMITSSDCEGAGEVFTVVPNEFTESNEQDEFAGQRFFGSPKYLTVSSQLHLEALAQSVGKVWTLSPAFRAEKSDTARHLSEFYMLEAELAFISDLASVTGLVEDLVKSLVKDVAESPLGHELLEHCKSEYASLSADVLEQRWSNVISGPWRRVTYHDAVQELLHASNSGAAIFGQPVDDRSGLDTEHERFLVKPGQPVFVTDYPKAIKPFYMAPSADSARLGPVPTAACFDLLLPDVCEVVGGSMREHKLDALEENMRSQGLLDAASTTDGTKNSNASSLDWYLDLRRFGTTPHGGFGLGFDRLVAFIAGVSNIRDVVTFPRWHTRCTC